MGLTMKSTRIARRTAIDPESVELLFTPFFNKVTCFIEDAYFALTHDQADDDLILQLHLECIKRLIL